MISLAQVQVGQRGHVQQVDGFDDLSLRLLEMGLTPGVNFAMIGVAPLGDPIEIEIRGYRLSLRKQEAARVAVTLDA